MKKNQHWIAIAGWVAATLVMGTPVVLGQHGHGGQFTDEPAQMDSVNSGFAVSPLFTIGESVGEYTPPGIPDGMAMFKWNRHANRLVVNHELSSNGFPYFLANGTELSAARVSYFDIDRKSLGVTDAGVAYDTIIDGNGLEISADNPLTTEGGNPIPGMRRLCSANGFSKGEFGFRDDIFFTGEETGGGYEYALDVKDGVLYQLPALGKAAWESVTVLDTGNPRQTAILVGDDRAPAPLILYMGEKDYGSRDFLARNGLTGGQVYVWVTLDGDVDPSTWNGTGTSRSGVFVPIDIQGTPNTPGYDKYGYATQALQDTLAAAAGAFMFSRPEDVDVSPFDGTVAVLASTGRSQLFGGVDSWGTVYVVDTNFGAAITADLHILYDGDDAGGGQFSDPDEGLRSPDNLCWAKDGSIYIQEDRSVGGFGAVSGEEASMWHLDLAGTATRVLQIERSGIPSGQFDIDPNDLGDWESSGVIDVSAYFGLAPGKLLMANTQAHSLRGDSPDAATWAQNFVQGGQIFYIFVE